MIDTDEHRTWVDIVTLLRGSICYRKLGG